MKKKILALCLVVVLVATAITGVTLAYFTDTDDQANTFTVGKVDINLDEENIKTPEEDRTDEDQEYGTIMPGTVFVKDPTITVLEGSENSYIFLDITVNKYKSLFPIIALNAVADGDLTDAEFEACMKDGKFSTSTFLANHMKTPTFRKIINKWLGGITHTDWAIMDFYYDKGRDDVTADGNWMTIRLAYIGDQGNGEGILAAEQSVTFMETLSMPGTVTEAMINNGLTANKFNEGDPFVMDFTAYGIQAAELKTVEDAYNAYFDQNGNA